MKKFTKLLGIVLIMALVMSMGITAAFAQTVGTASATTGSITISNAAKGETYAVYKLFDATVSSTTDTTSGESTSIAYTGTIPTSLAAYFEKDSAGNITATDAAKATDGSLSTDAIAALTAWAEGQTAVAEAESDGSALTFAGLAYGYYVVTTTQGETAISVDSTRPDVTIVDKNTTTTVNNPKKYAGAEEAEDAQDTDNNVNIGDTVTYTITFGTASYDGTGEDAEIITSYIISDDFASGVLTNVTVTSITIGGADYKVGDPAAFPQFDSTTKTITIPWVTGSGTTADPYKSIYDNGAQIVITYTATVADTAAIDGAGNTNTATITYTTDGDHTPSSYPVTDTIYTYAIAIKKVDQSGSPLAGATFQFPFYVKATADTDGAYIYAGTTAPAEGDTSIVNELTTPDNGLIIVKGVKDETYSITETAAPAGYNKLTSPVSVTAVQTGSTTTNTTVYLDETGKIVDTQSETTTTVTVEISALAATPIVVVNNTGTELPSTGGIGTTIFYVVGSVLVIAAGILLITKKRMGRE